MGVTPFSYCPVVVSILFKGRNDIVSYLLLLMDNPSARACARRAVVHIPNPLPEFGDDRWSFGADGLHLSSMRHIYPRFQEISNSHERGLLSTADLELFLAHSHIYLVRSSPPLFVTCS